MVKWKIRVGERKLAGRFLFFPFFVTWLHLLVMRGSGEFAHTVIQVNITNTYSKKKKKKTQQWHEVIKPLTRSFELFLTFLDIFPGVSADMKFLLLSYPVFNYKCRSSFCNLWKFALIKSNSYNHEVCLVTAAGSSNRYAALDEIICPMFLYNSIIWQHGAQYNESLLSIGILRTN